MAFSCLHRDWTTRRYRALDVSNERQLGSTNYRLLYSTNTQRAGLVRVLDYELLLRITTWIRRFRSRYHDDLSDCESIASAIASLGSRK